MTRCANRLFPLLAALVMGVSIAHAKLIAPGFSTAPAVTQADSYDTQQDAAQSYPDLQPPPLVYVPESCVVAERQPLPGDILLARDILGRIWYMRIEYEEVHNGEFCYALSPLGLCGLNNRDGNIRAPTWMDNVNGALDYPINVGRNILNMAISPVVNTYNASTAFFNDMTLGNGANFGLTTGLGLLGAALPGLAPEVDALSLETRAVSESLATETAALRNPSVYEVWFEAPISGTSRTAQRASANNFFAGQLRSDAQFSNMFDEGLGGNVLQHMESGSGSALLNPPGTVWHHPFDNPNVMQLLQTGEHTAPSLQPVLHPGGIGGFGNFYGP